MKNLVLYTSQMGATQKYAEDIARRIGADCFSLKKYKKKDYGNYDNIIYGGWVMGSKIKGLDDFLADYDDIKDKNIIIFSSGISIPSKEARKTMISSNILDLYHVRYYQLRGSFDFSKLPFVQKTLLKFSMKANSVEGDYDMGLTESLVEKPIEIYDQDGVDKIVNLIKRIENGEI